MQERSFSSVSRLFCMASFNALADVSPAAEAGCLAGQAAFQQVGGGVQHIERALQLVDRAGQRLTQSLDVLLFCQQRAQAVDAQCLLLVFEFADVLNGEQQVVAARRLVECIRTDVMFLEPRDRTGEPASRVVGQFDAHLALRRCCDACRRLC